MSDTTVIRERFTLDDRTFTVLAEPWYDSASGEWKGRFLYVPLDRSLPHPLSTGALKRATQRDDVVRQLAAALDRELARALRVLVPRRTRRVHVR